MEHCEKSIAEFVKDAETLPQIDKVNKSQLAELSEFMLLDFDQFSDIRDKTELFFSLSGEDAAEVLKEVRIKACKELADIDEDAALLMKLEEQIHQMVVEIDKYSQETTKLPFHRAAILGKLSLDEDLIDKYLNIGIELFQKEVEQKTGSRSINSCPFGRYPRYLGGGWTWPWKRHHSWRVQTRQRREDVGCHFDHGPFPKVIKGYQTTHSRTFIMILLQGWGGKLAANNYHFFYKWWFVAIMGLTPWTLMWTLKARQY